MIGRGPNEGFTGRNEGFDANKAPHTPNASISKQGPRAGIQYYTKCYFACLLLWGSPLEGAGTTFPTARMSET